VIASVLKHVAPSIKDVAVINAKAKVLAVPVSFGFLRLSTLIFGVVPPTPSDKSIMQGQGRYVSLYIPPASTFAAKLSVTVDISE
jgi:hypothetical protein